MYNDVKGTLSKSVFAFSNIVTVFLMVRHSVDYI